MTDHRDNDDVPQFLVGVSFDDPFRAQEFSTAAARLASQGQLKLLDAVTVVKDDEGHTSVRETIDPQPGRAALSGAMWAGLVGLLVGGPVGWIAGLALGAGAGAVTAKVVDLGIPDEWVTWFRSAVQPGTYTVALLLSDLNRDALVAEVHRFSGAHLVYTNLEPWALDRIRDALGEAAGTDDTRANQTGADEPSTGQAGTGQPGNGQPGNGQAGAAGDPGTNSSASGTPGAPPGGPAR